jgi:hypothetical protein
MLQQFVPAADEVWRLQHAEGPECDLFRAIAEQGHYAGRTVPTDTRQGIYATTPRGTLLGSINTRSARRVAAMMESALARWEQIPEEERYLEHALGADSGPIGRRWERLYPRDGLVLRVNSRDLPRPEDQAEPAAERRGRRGRGWRRRAWNQDYAWFSASEMMTFVPRRRAVGQSTRLPARLSRRIARLHLIDNVRGQTDPFDAGHVEQANMTSRIVGMSDNRIVLAIEGRTRAVKAGREAREGEDVSRSPEHHDRGVETSLLGTAELDTGTGRFVRFDLVALGTRWGGTLYNARERDLEPNGIGFALSLAPDEEPVAPAFVWEYGWH